VDLLRRAIEQVRRRRWAASSGTGPVPDPPPDDEFLYGLSRGLHVVEPPEADEIERITLDAARQRLVAEIREYTDRPRPDEILLVKASPGVGKTTAAALVAEELAMSGRRVMYAGPRHDFFADVMGVADTPSLWYEWLPRQVGDDESGKVQTCPYAMQISVWMGKGYKGMDFCRDVCGWKYINAECVYHMQKARREPIIYAQHQHVSLGHPLASTFDAVIGDEYPIPAFLHRWTIPGDKVYPGGMDPTEPLAEVLAILGRHCSGAMQIDGEPLFTLLGGAEHVLEACEDFVIPAADAILSPVLDVADDAYNVPYNLLPTIVPLLAREARAILEQGDDYPHRILVRPGELQLLLRRPVNEQMPSHVIWLDATATPRLYEEVFGRPARVVDAQPRLRGTVYQVWQRQNGKTTLVNKGGGTNKLDQLAEQVKGIVRLGRYERPAVISFMGAFEANDYLASLPHTHFYAARGTNAFEDSDVLIVAGTPQPDHEAIDTMARMIFFDRMRPFQRVWSTPLRRYRWVAEDGKGRAYPTSGFWADPDMQAVLEALRECEIVQAAHRIRPVSRECDIYLLTNIPLEDLPPDRLMNIRELLEAPEGVNVFVWRRVVDQIEAIYNASGRVTASDIVAQCGVEYGTARRYMKLLKDSGEWVDAEPAITKRGPGRPPEGIKKAE
jgi:hypothetical protein